MGHHHSKAHDKLLATTLVGDLVLRKEGVVKIPVGAPLREALAVLEKNGYLSAPLWSDEYSSDFGFFDVLDAATYLATKQSLLTTGRSAEVFDTPVHLVANFSNRNPVVMVKRDEQLRDILDKILRHKVHRLAVVDEENTIVGVITQGTIIRWIDEHIAKLHPHADQSLADLGLAEKPTMFKVLSEAPVVEAIETMRNRGTGAVAVVNSKGSYVGAITARCFRGLTEEKALALLGPIGTIYEDGAFLSQLKSRCSTCEPSTTLRDVTAQLAKEKLHRAYVLNAAREPIGIVTLGDIIREIYEVK